MHAVVESLWNSSSFACYYWETGS